jgi:salicylate hydroxylase
MTSGEKLRVTVAGAGIAGLCAAIALRRAGHIVHVYERSGLNNEVGAAIHLPPNATRALLAWGLDPVRAKLVTVKSSFRAKAETLERFHVGTSESSITETYGAPWFFAHRVDLHDELKTLATGSVGEGVPVVIHARSQVTKYVRLSIGKRRSYSDKAFAHRKTLGSGCTIHYFARRLCDHIRRCCRH